MVSNKILTEFPICKDVNYLSTASIGIVPNPVIRKTEEFSVELAKGGTLFLDEEKEVSIYEDIREEGNRLLGCNSEDIAVFNSVSEALNCIAWSLELTEGKIVSTDIEFPSVTYPGLRIAEKDKIQINLVKAKNWCFSTDDILEAIDEKTKVLFLSHVEFLTGQKHDLRKITECVHEHGALVIIDGIQAAGSVPIDVKALNVDVYITGSYKWLLAPFGTAIAYISKDVYEKIRPPFVGWRSVEDIWSFKPTVLKYAPTARKFEYSTSAYGVKIGFSESIKYLRKIGIENIQKHNMKLIELLIKELNLIDGVEIVKPEERGSILTFSIEGKNSKDISKKFSLLERPIEMNIRQDMIRLSPHLYNTEEDIIHFINNIKKV